METKPSTFPCPNCKDKKDQRIVNTERKKDYIWRRRRCFVCDHQWSTYEMMSEDYKKFTQLKRFLEMASQLSKRLQM